MSYRLVALTGLAGLMVASMLHAQTAAPAAATSIDCSSASASIPDQRKDEDTIKRIEQGWLTAEYRGNPQFLECLLEPDYRTSGRNGQIRTRADVMGRVPTTTSLHQAHDVPRLDTIVVVHGDAASAHSIMHTTDKDGHPKEVHFVDTYTFHDGRWHAFSGADL